jgi:hypothetical protein
MTLHRLSDEVYFIGPPLSDGPLPTVFYFSLSAEESLSLDPFNQPVTYLSQFPLRIFSITLPGHEDNLPAKEALNKWACAIENGHNIIGDFIHKTQEIVDFLRKEKALNNKLAVAGLSRGAFIATHVAAQIPLFKTVLGFAPLTELDRAKEFESIKDNSLVTSLRLHQLIPKLTSCSLRFYIGNLDTRVSTRACFDFIEALAQTSTSRSPPVELIISPSIGKDGHGTSEAIFHQGAHWIAQQLGVVDGM